MRHLLLFLVLWAGSTAQAQDKQVIYLENPSFEGQPSPGRLPTGWSDCGHPQESPPDIQPYGGFNVTRPAQDGRTYLGLVSRDNKTWESVAQRLTDPLQQGSCYKFSIHACKSSIYISPTRKNQSQPINFEKGLVLRVWGGNSTCDRAELLDQVDEAINHFDWRPYEFELKPTKGSYSYLTIEAYYKLPALSWYNGNVLIDNASEIFSCDIPTEPIAIVDPKPNLRPKDPIRKQPDPVTPKDDPLAVPDKTPNTSSEGIVARDRGNFDLARIRDVEIGDKFRLEELQFRADSASITVSGQRELMGVFHFLKNNPNLSLEVGGHTNGLPPHSFCDRLSTARAKNVVRFLKGQGIDPERMSYKGYGKRRPIATNDTKAGRSRNQRVEIIITDKTSDG